MKVCTLLRVYKTTCRPINPWMSLELWWPSSTKRRGQARRFIILEEEANAVDIRVMWDTYMPFAFSKPSDPSGKKVPKSLLSPFSKEAMTRLYGSDPSTRTWIAAIAQSVWYIVSPSNLRGSFTAMVFLYISLSLLSRIEISEWNCDTCTTREHGAWATITPSSVSLLSHQKGSHSLHLSSMPRHALSQEDSPNS